MTLAPNPVRSVFVNGSRITIEAADGSTISFDVSHNQGSLIATALMVEPPTITKTEERLAARKVLGFNDDNGKAIPMDQRTPEALLETLYLRNMLDGLRAEAMMTAEKRFLEKIKIERKAKHLANARADRAEAAMRAMLDTLKEGAVK